METNGNGTRHEHPETATAMGMAMPPSAVVSTGFRAPALRSSSYTDTSWLSALDT